MTNKIRTLDDLRRVREASTDLTSARSKGRASIIVGMGTCGIAAGAREVMSAALRELEKRNIHDVSLTATGCIGMCEKEPLVDVIVPGMGRITYGLVSPEDMAAIVAEHVVNGHVVERLVIGRAD